jgi:hypothetical protein
MYFTVDTANQSVIASRSLGAAARVALKKLSVPYLQGDDHVALFRQVNPDERFALLNLSGAFESVSESDDQAAQELAASFKQAIDHYYATNKR